MATRSLSPNHAAERVRQLRAAAMTLAMMRARNVVKDALKRKGAKVSLVPSCQITTLAKAYLAQQRDALMADARATVEQWIAEGVFGKNAQRAWCANLESAAQTQNESKSTTSIVQISGA